MGTWPRRTCLCREPLHGHPGYTVVTSPLEGSYLCVQSIKAPPRNKVWITNRWLGLHFWPSHWKSWLLDAVKITGAGLEEAHERWQACVLFYGKCVHQIRNVGPCMLGGKRVENQKKHMQTHGLLLVSTPRLQGALLKGFWLPLA